MTLRERLARVIKGDAADDAQTREIYSRDTSIFERRPEVVVFPKVFAETANAWADDTVVLVTVVMVLLHVVRPSLPLS